jgi:hypothetical protein
MLTGSEDGLWKFAGGFGRWLLAELIRRLLLGFVQGFTLGREDGFWLDARESLWLCLADG